MSDQDGNNFLDAINSIIQQTVRGAFYITFYRLGIDRYFASMARTGLQCRSLIIWDKGNHTLSNSDYMSMYEPMFYGWVNEHNFYGGNNGMDIWGNVFDIKIEYVSPESLIPYEKNARTHTPDQVDQICESIKQFGFTNPILISEKKEVIAGHGRLDAAKILKLERVPAIVLSGLSEEQRRAYVIADNKIALNSGWDEDLLLEEILFLQEKDFDLSLIGFSDEELNALLPDEEVVS